MGLAPRDYGLSVFCSWPSSEADEENKENEHGRTASKVLSKQVNDAKRVLTPRGSFKYALVPLQISDDSDKSSTSDDSDVDYRDSGKEVRVPASRRSHSSEAECLYDGGIGEIEGEKETVESEGEDNEERCVRARTNNNFLRQKQNFGKFRHRAEEQAEKYFSSRRHTAGSKAASSSGRSLSRLDSSVASDILDTVHNPYRDSIDALHRMYRDLYQYWLFQISQGFNVLLYGMGSKRKVLEGFRTAHLTGTYNLVIDGCHPEVAFKNALSKILSEVLEYTNRISSPISQCQHRL